MKNFSKLPLTLRRPPFFFSPSIYYCLFILLKIEKYIISCFYCSRLKNRLFSLFTFRLEGDLGVSVLYKTKDLSLRIGLFFIFIFILETKLSVSCVKSRIILHLGLSRPTHMPEFVRCDPANQRNVRLNILFIFCSMMVEIIPSNLSSSLSSILILDFANLNLRV